MVKFLFSTLLVSVVLFTTSCKQNVLHGEGATSTSSPVVSSFSEVSIELPLKATVTVQEGSQPGIQISGYTNVIEHIKARVESNSLILSSDLDETWRIDGDGITVNISMPSITALSLSGAADADIHGNVTGRQFELETSGASTVVIDNLNVDSFSSDVSGACNIEVKSGLTKKATYAISGAAKIKAFPLQTLETVTSISGAGKGEVSASQKLTVEISGAGDVKYKGNPAITKDISGAGSVTAVN